MGWDQTLEITIALLGNIVFPPMLEPQYDTQIIILANTLLHGYENQKQVKYYPIKQAILSGVYHALGKYKKGHRYFQGCNLLLHWQIIIHLSKGHWIQQLHTLKEYNTLRDLNDMLFRADLEKKKNTERWAQIFYGLREEDIQWMFNHLISKDVVVRVEK